MEIACKEFDKIVDLVVCRGQHASNNGSRRVHWGEGTNLYSAQVHRVVT